MFDDMRKTEAHDFEEAATRQVKKRQDFLAKHTGAVWLGGSQATLSGDDSSATAKYVRELAAAARHETAVEHKRAMEKFAAARQVSREHDAMVLPRTPSGHIHPVVYIAALIGFGSAVYQSAKQTMKKRERHDESEKEVDWGDIEPVEVGVDLGPRSGRSPRFPSRGDGNLEGLRRRSSLEV
jgi:hypothetical protein